MIPISLKVTMDVIKYAYSLIIEWDLKMYYAPTDTPATVNKYDKHEDFYPRKSNFIIVPLLAKTWVKWNIYLPTKPVLSQKIL